jgi:type II secretory pathway pseudopilin PulG
MCRGLDKTPGVRGAGIDVGRGGPALRNSGRLGGWALHDVGRWGPTLHAFTLVELIIVITVIVLILAIAIPGLSAMGAEARLTAAQQTIQGMTTQAYSLALANRAMTAVRFFPGEWDTVDPAQQRVPGGRQHLAIYSYVATSEQENPPGSGNFVIAFGEYFERAKDLSSAALPEDVWVAPLEALSAQGTIAHTDGTLDPPFPLGQNFVLDGTAGQFRFNADRAIGDGGDLLNADDFLIVNDPETGIRTSTPTPFRLRAYAPAPVAYDVDQDPTTSNWYQRYSFSGVVTYRREPFMSLPGGAAAAGVDRQNYLRDSGRPFMMHRFSGGLLPGMQRPATP